jgi:hypothetical protein
MNQHFTAFRKPHRLSGQALVVLTKRNFFPLDKRSAYAHHGTHIFRSKDDSLLRCHYPSMFTTLYQLGITQFRILNHLMPWRSTREACTWAILAFVKSANKRLNISISTVANKKGKGALQSFFSILYQNLCILLIMVSHTGGQHQTMFGNIAYPYPKLALFFFHSLRRFFFTKDQSSSNSTLLTFKSLGKKTSISSLCSAARLSQDKTVSAFDPNTPAMPRTLIPLSNHSSARITLSSGGQRSKKTVPVSSLNTLRQILQVNLRTRLLLVEYVPLDTIISLFFLP